MIIRWRVGIKSLMLVSSTSTNSSAAQIPFRLSNSLLTISDYILSSLIHHRLPLHTQVGLVVPCKHLFIQHINYIVRKRSIRGTWGLLYRSWRDTGEILSWSICQLIDSDTFLFPLLISYHVIHNSPCLILTSRGRSTVCATIERPIIVQPVGTLLVFSSVLLSLV